MINQYKPSKPQKVKPAKPAKPAKAASPMGVGSATAVKFDKPKKVKEPKAPKAPKPEKVTTFTPSKVQKAAKFEGVGKLKQPLNPKVMIGIIAAVVIVVLAVVAAVFIFPGDDDTPAVKPQTLTITTLPQKIEYYVGETAVFAGLKVDVTLSNGVSVTLDESEYEISGFDSSVPDDSQTITVKYKELQTSFTISVREMQSSDLPTSKYTGLSFKTLPKTQYKVGEFLSTTGGVLLVHYEDGSTREMALIDDYVYGFGSDNPGTYTLTVKYMERGLYGETTYDITVTN